MWDGAPQFVKLERRKLRLDRELHSCLQKFYGITLFLDVCTSSPSPFDLLFGSNRALGVL